MRVREWGLYSDFITNLSWHLSSKAKPHSVEVGDAKLWFCGSVYLYMKVNVILFVWVFFSVFVKVGVAGLKLWQ